MVIESCDIKSNKVKWFPELQTTVITLENREIEYIISEADVEIAAS